MPKQEKKNTIWIKPSKTGAAVRRGTFELPANGAEVESDNFWNRRLRQGDVVECDPPKKKGKSGKGKDAEGEDGKDAKGEGGKDSKPEGGGTK